jgi:hypothetical protein
VGSVSEDREANPVERLLERKTDDAGVPLSRHATQYQRSLEAYFKAGDPPRWMTRLTEIENGIARERRRVESAYRALRAAGPPDFSERWRETAAAWRFDDGLNELIELHNEWYPIERRLPVDLRTRDYVRVNGRSYRRPVLDAAWILENFPA